MVGFCATDADSPYDGDTSQVEGESRWIARWQWGGLIRWATKGSRRKRVYVRGWSRVYTKATRVWSISLCRDIIGRN